MRNRISFHFLSSIILTFSVCVAVFAQEPAATTLPQARPLTATTEATQPRRRVPTPSARVTVIRGDSQDAPQVVTIIHRLSGVKMLRLLRRQTGEGGVIETIDPKTLMSDAHASIIAGWAMDDGKTIAARLPQAAAEIEFGQFPMSPFEPGKFSAAATTRPPLVQARTEPDLTVITNDGRRLRARYVGLDAQT